MRAAVRRRHAPRLQGTGEMRQKLLESLPFGLTGAQQRVSAEIAKDIAEPRPMLRLVQGFGFVPLSREVAAKHAKKRVERGYVNLYPAFRKST